MGCLGVGLGGRWLPGCSVTTYGYGKGVQMHGGRFIGAQSVHATMNLFVSAAKNALGALALHRTPLQHQDFANALECTHWQFPNSSSILADTYYYLDSATVSSMDSR